MSTENTETKPTGAPAEPGGNPTAPSPTTEQAAFTAEQQARVDAIVQERLRRDREARAAQMRKELEAELEAKRKEAEMSELERAKAELERVRAEAEQARATALNAERRAALAGLVSNPERVLKLMGNDVEQYFADGKPNSEAIIKDFPEYRPQAAGPTPLQPGGGPIETPDSKISDEEFFKRAFSKK